MKFLYIYIVAATLITPSSSHAFDGSLDMIGIEGIEKKIANEINQKLFEKEVNSRSFESKHRPSAGSSSDLVGASVADLIARMTYMEEEVRKLRGEVSSLEFELEELQKNKVAATDSNQSAFQNGNSLEDAASQYVARPGEENAEYVIRVEDVLGEQAEADEAVESDPEEDDFNAALAEVSNQDLAAAKERFLAFTNAYPESENLNESHFWLGEIAMDEADYKSAALSYLKSYKSDKTAERGKEALLKASTALGKLGKKEEACRNLTSLQKMQNLQALLRDQASSEAVKLGCET